MKCVSECKCLLLWLPGIGKWLKLRETTDTSFNHKLEIKYPVRLLQESSELCMESLSTLYTRMGLRKDTLDVIVPLRRLVLTCSHILANIMWNTACFMYMAYILQWYIVLYSTMCQQTSRSTFINCAIACDAIEEGKFEATSHDKTEMRRSKNMNIEAIIVFKVKCIQSNTFMC